MLALPEPTTFPPRPTPAGAPSGQSHPRPTPGGAPSGQSHPTAHGGAGSVGLTGVTCHGSTTCPRVNRPGGAGLQDRETQAEPGGSAGRAAHRRACFYREPGRGTGAGRPRMFFRNQRDGLWVADVRSARTLVSQFCTQEPPPEPNVPLLRHRAASCAGSSPSARTPARTRRLQQQDHLPSGKCQVQLRPHSAS